MINELVSEHFRTDSVNIVIRTGKSYINRVTLEVVQELPEDAIATDWAEYWTKLRNDQTGHIYEIAHDVEGSDQTYSEMYYTEESYCERSYGSSTIGTGGVCSFNTDVYPTYKSENTYAKGDIVTSNHMTWISDFDDNTGNDPTIYGWSLYLPFIEKRNVEYGTYEEIYGNS